MRRIRTWKRLIAALTSIALICHVLLMVLAGSAVPFANGGDRQAVAVIVDPVLGPVTLCASHAANLSTDDDPDTSGSAPCFLCSRLADLSTPLPTGVPYRRLHADATRQVWAPTGVSTLAEQVRRGGIRGRAPPARV